MLPENFNLTKAAYSMNELSGVIPLSRGSIYAAINDKRLKVAKFGGKMIFLAPDIVEFLVGLPKE